MGGGNWSGFASRARASSRTSMPAQRVFKSRGCHELMSPNGLLSRESRDSDEHPDSLAFIWWLDVTGSMGQIPEQLAKRTLPDFADVILPIAPDMQILFGAVGDAVDGDRAPWQIGQWESSDQLVDQWLTRIYLAGGGGQHGCESYDLAFLFAARLAEIDCYLKRGRKGYLFLTGDECPYETVQMSVVNRLLGRHFLESDIPFKQIVAEACEKFHCFFLIPDLRRAEYCAASWRRYLGDKVLIMEDPADASLVAAMAAGLTEGVYADLDQVMAVLRDRHGQDEKAAKRIFRALRSYAALLERAGQHRQIERTPIETSPGSGGVTRLLV